MSKIEMGKQYRTRDGRPVRIFCVDFKNMHSPEFTVLGVYELDNEKEYVSIWSAEGRYVSSLTNSDLDLIEVRPRIKIERWVNLYKNSEGVPSTGSFYDSREKCNRADTGRAACVRIEIDCEEGEGLDT